ncbi:hypothetical protein H632_c5185p0, partial [Helicosporidium sp. ATCC 50920]
RERAARAGARQGLRRGAREGAGARELPQPRQSAGRGSGLSPAHPQEAGRHALRRRQDDAADGAGAPDERLFGPRGREGRQARARELCHRQGEPPGAHLSAAARLARRDRRHRPDAGRQARRRARRGRRGRQGARGRRGRRRGPGRGRRGSRRGGEQARPSRASVRREAASVRVLPDLDAGGGAVRRHQLPRWDSASRLGAPSS